MEAIKVRPAVGVFLRERILKRQGVVESLRSLVTPWNAIAAVILAVGAPVAVLRFTRGLGAVTNLSDTNPWGVWIAVDVLCGVALAAGGYTMGVIVHVLRVKEYQPLARPAVLTGFLGYVFVVIGLLFDLGRPWRLAYPMAISLGLTSVMFVVAWHFFLYLVCQAIEFSPVVFQWLNLRRLRQWMERATLWVTIVGAIVATGHQAALGALFLMASGKLHPLWYSPMLPLFFFISSIAAGLSMVIVESSISHRAFHHRVGPGASAQLNIATLGLAKASAVILFAYFWLKVVGIAADNAWRYLATGPGFWFLEEMLLFVLLPSFLFLLASRERSTRLARFAAFLTVIGIIVNRINVAIIGFNWQTETYVPRWTEIVITISIVTTLILAYRWIVNRMPVLEEHADSPEHS